MKSVVLICVFITLYACKSPEKLANEKAIKEALARQQRLEDLKELRKQYPCDTTSKTDTVTQYKFIKGDTIYLAGGVKVVHDTIQTEKIVNKTVKVLDQARIKELQDSLAQTNYLFGQAAETVGHLGKENDELKKENARLKDEKSEWKNKAIYTWIGIGLLFGSAIFSKIKGFI